jgi:hypothetical protein
LTALVASSAFADGLTIRGLSLSMTDQEIVSAINVYCSKEGGVLVQRASNKEDATLSSEMDADFNSIYMAWETKYLTDLPTLLFLCLDSSGDNLAYAQLAKDERAENALYFSCAATNSCLLTMDEFAQFVSQNRGVSLNLSYETNIFSGANIEVYEGRAPSGETVSIHRENQLYIRKGTLGNLPPSLD